MIRIIICDDQDIVREGLCTILESDGSIEVIDTASDGQQLLERIKSHYPRIPDLVLLDLKMPVLGGIGATKAILKHWPEIKVLILTTYADDQWVFDAIKAGASGYLLKDTPKQNLIDAIRGTVEGDTYVDPSVAGKLLPYLRSRELMENGECRLEMTERERTLLVLIAKGLSNAEIATRLFLSPGTVRNYTSMLFSKLGVSDRTEAAITALREGIISLDDI